ncbi:methyltransferase domain-containing protein [Thiopseudomonas alkaliphila]|uniref:methyltransferase domain-containing protein n=1 Tax=Thiopseudomonas alkaliphila TaxID=1697053 RepID=UPI00257919AD|nr:methyltransferase domain-containing protein [Thiopseudomonas alkaliphila]MDM1707053.1 methyltransferase domain-containing protein [Thiopseudomonas alkaliphila]
MHDHHFDELATRFAEKIYGGTKGAIRLAVIQQDLLEQLPERPLRVLDIGGGLGHIALWLAEQGHTITFTEPAQPMLEAAKQRFAKANCTARFIHSPWQKLPELLADETFDLVICHAVLEWLAEPWAILPVLQQFTRQHGWLSLAFYNKDALIFRNLIKGNLRKLSKMQFQGDAGGLTPQQPLDPREVQQQLAQHWQIRTQSGVRVFHDYMLPKFQQKIALDEMISTELSYRRHPSLGPLGRYLHWLCQPHVENL